MVLIGLHENLPSASLAAALGSGPPLNFRLLLPFAPFPLLLLALLLVLPGIREQRALSLLALLIHLCIGILLVGAIVLPFWKCSEAEVLVQLQAQSRQRHHLRLGVAVGLRALNISLDYVRLVDETTAANEEPSNKVDLNQLHLNEQFDLAGVSAMASELHRAYVQGQPFPILRVLEYFSLGQDAFAWGHQFRNAGHFAHALLWASFVCWLAQCALLPLLPHHFAKVGLLCAILALVGNSLFVALSPSDLHIAFPSPSGGTNFLQFRFGACFWMSILAGLLALLFSSVLCVLQLLRLYSLSTFLSCSLDETVGPPKCRFGGGRQCSSNSGGSERPQDCGWTALSDSRLESTVSAPSCKFSVSSSVSSLSVSSSVCSSAISALRTPRGHQAMEPTIKSVDLIRSRILARQQQQENQVVTGNSNAIRIWGGKKTADSIEEKKPAAAVADEEEKPRRKEAIISGGHQHKQRQQATTLMQER